MYNNILKKSLIDNVPINIFKMFLFFFLNMIDLNLKVLRVVLKNSYVV